MAAPPNQALREVVREDLRPREVDGGATSAGKAADSPLCRHLGLHSNPRWPTGKKMRRDEIRKVNPNYYLVSCYN